MKGARSLWGLNALRTDNLLRPASTLSLSVGLHQCSFPVNLQSMVYFGHCDLSIDWRFNPRRKKSKKKFNCQIGAPLGADQRRQSNRAAFRCWLAKSYEPIDGSLIRFQCRCWWRCQRCCLCCCCSAISDAESPQWTTLALFTLAPEQRRWWKRMLA